MDASEKFLLTIFSISFIGLSIIMGYLAYVIVEDLQYNRLNPRKQTEVIYIEPIDDNWQDMKAE